MTGPNHGVLRKPGPRGRLVPMRQAELPPWHRWKRPDSAAAEVRRVARWCRSELKIPTGYGAAGPMVLHPFQKDLLRVVYANFATFVSMPTGNAKTTLFAAIGLERICRGDDYAKVDVVATKEDQARKLLGAVEQFIESNARLAELCALYTSDGIIEYRPTGSRMEVHPRKLSALQGLNFSLALVDEVGFLPAEVVMALLARLPKRPDARLVGFGTPGFDEGASILEQFHDDVVAGKSLPPGAALVEHAARADVEVDDPAGWEEANPALVAGFLGRDQLAMLAGSMPEREFRAYHLGQWVDSTASWLPADAWDTNPVVCPPPDGTEVVLAVDGTYRTTVAVVGCSLSGEVFLSWVAESATDSEVRRELEAAVDRWNVVEVVHNRRIRAPLMADLASEGMPVEPWVVKADEDAQASTELYRAIIEGSLPHDHDPQLGGHVEALGVRQSRDGSLVLVRPDSGRSADAALALRMAWWRAKQLAGVDTTAPVIY
jgi:phage terminase large subunit-like protein